MINFSITKSVVFVWQVNNCNRNDVRLKIPIALICIRLERNEQENNW